MTTVTTWDNQGQWVRHRATTKNPAPWPGQFAITLLMISFLLKRISLQTSSLKRATLRNGETAYLWVRFVVRFYVPKAPAKAASIVVSFTLAIQKEEMHQSVRRIALTTVYVVGAVVLLASAPKVVMLVWAA